MKNMTLTLFESSQACFRLTLQTLYERIKPDGTVQNKVFYNRNNDSINANLGTFLCFYYYVADDFSATKAVFTTSAHIYSIRQAVTEIHNRIYAISNDKTALTKINGKLVLNAKYTDDVVIQNIGKKSDWISFRVYVDEATNNLMVGIITSKSSGYTSNLFISEFYQVYDIIMHLDFASIEMNALILEMVSRMNNLQGRNVQPRRTQSAFPRYAAPYGNFQEKPTISEPVEQSVTTAAPHVYKNSVSFQTVPNYKGYQTRENVHEETKTVSSAAPLPPRDVQTETSKSKPIMNLDEIENIDVGDDDEFNYDDSSLVDDIN